jgi:hypothetical protein
MGMKQSALVATLVLCSTAVAIGFGCWIPPDCAQSTPTTPTEPGIRRGDTALVALVNPVVNDGNGPAVPAIMGSTRDGVPVVAAPGSVAVTSRGLAVVRVDRAFLPDGGLDASTGGLPDPCAPGDAGDAGADDAGSDAGDAGPVEFTIGVGNASIPYEGSIAGELYEVAVAYDGANAAFYQGTPLRWPLGAAQGGTTFCPAGGLADVTPKLAEDDAVVVLASGTYTGDLVITGNRVMLVGEGPSGGEVTLKGSITVQGQGVRLRGLRVTGALTVTGDDFGMTFSVIEGSASLGGKGGILLRNVLCVPAKAPAGGAVLLDNYGLAPTAGHPSGVCP